MTTFREICDTLGSDPREEPVSDQPLEGVSTLGDPRPRTLSFSTGWDQYVEATVRALPETSFIVPPQAPPLANVVRHPKPRLAFAQALRAHFAESAAGHVAPTAVVGPDAVVGSNVTLGHFSVIEDGATIGDGCVVGHHTVIAKGVTLAEGVSVGTHCSIGGAGFGFEHDDDGRPLRILHLGGVQIGSGTEIGNHVSIARGTIVDTRIGEHVKIDDTVFIAHNVVVGDNTFIIAGAEISGSVTIGKDVWISPEATVINKITIGDRALVGIGAVVLRNVRENTVVAGVPAKERGQRFPD